MRNMTREQESKIHEIFAEVSSAMESDPFNRANARDMFLRLFRENGIPESAYEPWMCNNVLPAISLVG